MAIHQRCVRTQSTLLSLFFLIAPFRWANCKRIVTGWGKIGQGTKFFKFYNLL